MKKNKRKFIFKNIFWIVSAALLTINTCFASFANTPVSVEMNFSEKFPKMLHIERNKLGIEQIPLIPKFNYFLVLLRDEKGQEAYRKSYKNTSGNLYFTFENVSDGKYSLEVYTAPEQYTKYKAVLYGTNAEITIQNGNTSFIQYPYYEYNMGIFNNKRTDEIALLYYKQPSYNIQSDNQEIIDLALSITAGMDNDYNKAMAIHDWVCNNIYYDRDSVKDGSYINLDTSALGTLHTKKSVCDGYCNLTAALLRAAGIPGKRIIGFAMGVTSENWPENFDRKRDSNHAWNEAWINGRWLIMDTTWDSANVWENGEVSQSDGLRGYSYFDISPDLFSSDHIIADYREDMIPKPQQ